MRITEADCSRLAESVTPEELIEMLRAFHLRMKGVVFDHGGTLDKFLGDGVMATFGTPRTESHDAANTLRCARHAGCGRYVERVTCGGGVSRRPARGRRALRSDRHG